MTEFVDVCIVGGGIVGLSCAAELTRSGFTVRLIDKDYAGASRGNIGDIGLQGHAPLLDEFVRFSKTCWLEGGAFMAQDIGLMPTGSVQLALSETEYAFLEKAYNDEQLSGLKTHLETDREVLRDVLGAVEMPENCAGAKLVSSDLAIEPHTALTHLRQYLTKQGGLIWGSDRIQEFLLDQKGTVHGVTTDAGDVCMAEVTLICSESQARHLLPPLGVRVPLRPSRAHILTMTPNGHMPVQTIVHPCEQGYIRIRRIDGGRVLVAYDGILDPVQNTYSQEVDPPTVEWMREKIGEILPALKNAMLHETKIITLTMTPDFAPCVGQYHNKEGLLLALGMNGRGYAYAAAVGRVITSILMDQPYPVNLGPLQPDRFELKSWKPIDIYGVLPTYVPSFKHSEDNEETSDKTEKEGEVAAQGGATEGEGDAKAAPDVVVDEKEIQQGQKETVFEETEDAPVADVVTTEKEIQQGHKETAFEKTEDAPLPDVVMTEKEIQQGHKETVFEETEEAPLANVVMTEKEIQQGNAEKAFEKSGEKGALSQPVLVDKGAQSQERADVRDVEKQEQRAENVEMVGHDAQKQTAAIATSKEENESVQAAVVQQAQKEKLEAKKMMMSKKNQKVEVSFGAESLVRLK